MGWLIAGVVIVVLAALIWWSSGRAKPDRRARSIQSEIDTQEGRTGSFDTRKDIGLGGF
jgi:hypothetical protein